MTKGKEQRAIARALDDPATRAVVIVLGVLLDLPSDRSRARVLQWVYDKIDEEAHA